MKMRFFLPLIIAVLLGACAPVYDAHYWREYTWYFQQQGKMRTDRNPTDVSFTNADLAQSFSIIMFHSEELNTLTGTTEIGEEFPLMRHEGVFEYAIGNGATVQDREQISAFVQRISALTGLETRENPETDFVRIEFLDHDARIDLGETLSESQTWYFAGEDLKDGMPGLVCVAYTTLPDDVAESRVLIIIRDELEGLMRQSCIEEEIGQAFGPNADYDKARPSIFNDDEEFALFTEHDALLFRVLYDPRLKRGMTKDEAMPIARKIIAELRPNQ